MGLRKRREKNLHERRRVRGRVQARQDRGARCSSVPSCLACYRNASAESGNQGGCDSPGMTACGREGDKRRCRADSRLLHKQENDQKVEMNCRVRFPTVNYRCTPARKLSRTMIPALALPRSRAGKRIYADGGEYDGDWHEGRRHGRGVSHTQQQRDGSSSSSSIRGCGNARRPAAELLPRPLPLSSISISLPLPSTVSPYLPQSLPYLLHLDLSLPPCLAILALSLSLSLSLSTSHPPPTPPSLSPSCPTAELLPRSEAGLAPAGTGSHRRVDTDSGGGRRPRAASRLRESGPRFAGSRTAPVGPVAAGSHRRSAGGCRPYGLG